MKKDLITLCGGLVIRTNTTHEDELFDVLLIHRPKKGDWSFPKGRLDSKESLEGAAWREVQEETGLTINFDLMQLAGHAMWGRRVAYYWTMFYADPNFPRTKNEPGFVPNDEVDKVKWVRLSKVHRHLSHQYEVKMVQRVLDRWEKNS